MIRVKRAYTAVEDQDGTRYLVDRFWPRGVKRENLALADWVQNAAPSAGLCKWFGHDPALWEEFCRRYWAELESSPGTWSELLEAVRRGSITLVYGARDEEHNNAVALKLFLEKHTKGD